MEEQVRHVRNQRPSSSHLLKKYEYQYQLCLQHELEDEEYGHRTGKSLKKRGDTHDHWHCLFFRYCWDSGMSRLPTVKDCLECGSWKRDADGVPVFRRLGPVRPSTSKLSHRAKGRTLKRRRINITGRTSALMDLTVPRNVGYSGCAVWRKPRPNISRC
jgi:hypothetical protein